MPNLTLPAEKETGNIGVWALRHKRYLKHHHKVLYYNLLTSGKLHSHLADIEEQAQALFSRLVRELAEKEGVTEQLKSADQMAWVRKMNNIRNLAAEIVNVEVVFV
ncbi:MAG: TnpV protein [Sphaerochaetaceae bacterium]|nr:TnpV protein [Sphaerochaetaceae bacterium]